MKEKTDVLQGTLALMALKTLDVLGPLHGYGIARRIEQISGDLLTVNQGTLYPVLLKLEQEGPSRQSGGLQRITARRVFTGLRGAGAKGCSPRHETGNRRRQSSGDSLTSRRRISNEATSAIL